MGQRKLAGVQLQALCSIAAPVVTIEFIPQDRMADSHHVYPQLVRSPGMGAEFDAATLACRIMAEQCVVRQGRLAVLEIHLLARPVWPVGDQRQCDVPVSGDSIPATTAT